MALSAIFFLYGFAKNKKDNIDDKELETLQRSASIFLSYSTTEVDFAVEVGKLIEVNYE